MLCLLPLLQEWKFTLPPHAVREIFIYATPLLGMGLASTTNEMFSRVLLVHWLPEGFYMGISNEAVLGIFGACYKLAALLLLGIQAFRYAADPFFFAHAKNLLLLTQVMRGFVLAGCWVLLAVSINLDWIGRLFLQSASYRMAIEIVPYLMLGYLLLGVYYNLAIWFKITDKTYYGLRIAGIGAMVTVGMNLALIPFLGYWGSVWATISSYSVMCILGYRWGQRHYPVPYQWKQLLGYIAGTMVTTWAIRQTPDPGLVVIWVENCLLLGVAGWMTKKYGMHFW